MIINKLTVGIISYNRPEELKRCLNSILPIPDNVEILVCDDHSPRKLEIVEVVSDFKKSNINVKIHVNQENLGYDKNLFNTLELADSEYILLLGDDDMLEPDALNNVMEIINGLDFNVGFLRVRFSDVLMESLRITKISYDRNYSTIRFFSCDELQKNGSYLYNSILFSGLVFKKKSVLEFKKEIVEYFNSIYIQVAIFSLLSIKYGSYFLPGPGIMIGSDGENGFGLNQSASERDKVLINRKSQFSNLNYQVRLIEVVRKVANNSSVSMFNSFLREYRIRFIKSAWTARRKGRKQLYEYFKYSYLLNLPTIRRVYPLLLILFILPNNIVDFILFNVEKVIHEHRKNKNNI